MMPDLRAREQSAFAREQSAFAWEQSVFAWEPSVFAREPSVFAREQSVFARELCSNRGMPYPFAGEPYDFLGRISEESRTDREFVRRRGPSRTEIDEGLESQSARVESPSGLGASVRAHARMP